METQITCPSCGASNPAGKVLCTSCGRAVMRGPHAAAQQTPSPQLQSQYISNTVPPAVMQPIAVPHSTVSYTVPTLHQSLPTAQSYWSLFLQRPEHWFAATLIAAFFLPWISIASFINISGLQIPDIARGLQQLTFAFNQDATVSLEAILLNLVYLIPILAATTLVMGLMGNSSKMLGILTGTLPLIIFVLIVVKVGGTLLQVMGIGAYLTLIGAIGMIVTECGAIKAA